jgi:hypothetical protein
MMTLHTRSTQVMFGAGAMITLLLFQLLDRELAAMLPAKTVGPLPPNPDSFPTAPPPEAPNPVGPPFNTMPELGAGAAGGSIGVTDTFSPPSGGVVVTLPVPGTVPPPAVPMSSIRQECLALYIGLQRQFAGDNAAFPDSSEHRIGSETGP